MSEIYYVSKYTGQEIDDRLEKAEVTDENFEQHKNAEGTEVHGLGTAATRNVGTDDEDIALVKDVVYLEGMMPSHEWDGTDLRFQLSKDEWGSWVDLGQRIYDELKPLRDATKDARDVAEDAAQEAEVAEAGAVSAQELSEEARDDTVEYKNIAESHKDKAEQWADEEQDVEVETGKYSAKHHSMTAEEHKDGADSARNQAETYKNDAESAESSAVSARNDAQDARDTAQIAESSAESYRDDAQDARDTAETHKDDAESARDVAQSAKTDAETAESGAQSARDDAQDARDKSEQWASEDEGVVVENGLYSARHYAKQAEEMTEGLTADLNDHKDATGTNVHGLGNASTRSVGTEDSQVPTNSDLADVAQSGSYDDLSGVPSEFTPESHGDEAHTESYATETWVSDNFNDYEHPNTVQCDAITETQDHDRGNHTDINQALLTSSDVTFNNIKATERLNFTPPTGDLDTYSAWGNGYTYAEHGPVNGAVTASFALNDNRGFQIATSSYGDQRFWFRGVHSEETNGLNPWTELATESQLFSGSYNDLSNVPSEFTPESHGDEAHTEDYAKESQLFSGSYNDLSNVPSEFTPENHGDEAHTEDYAKEYQLFSGSYNDLTNVPSEFTPENHGDGAHTEDYAKETWVSDNFNNYTHPSTVQCNAITDTQNHGDEKHTENYLKSVPTSYGAVGTYVWGCTYGVSGFYQGDTIAGSDIHPAGAVRGSTGEGSDDSGDNLWGLYNSGVTMSGTWRVMGRNRQGGNSENWVRHTLFVRIS